MRKLEMNKLLFAPITKVFEAADGTVEVDGVLACEEPDLVGEIFDYKSSKPNFQAWNEKFAAQTKELGVELSVGNLRAMHGKISAGKFTSMRYDDATKKIVVRAKVIDANEVEKVLSGVYTGFSIGAKYARRWREGSLTRWTADPYEGSLVDNPCMPSASFTRVGRSGEEKVCSFQTTEKDLYLVQTMASIVQQLTYLRDAMRFEQESEGDASPATQEVSEATTRLLDALASYTAEQVEEEKNKSTEEKAMDKDAKARADKLKAMQEDLGKLATGLKAMLDEEAKKANSPESVNGAVTDAPATVEQNAAQIASTLAAKIAAGEANKVDAVKFISETVDAKLTPINEAVEKLAQTVNKMAETIGKIAGAPVSSAVATKAVGAGLTLVVDKTKDAGAGGGAAEKTIEEQAKTDAPGAIQRIHAGGGKRDLSR